MQFTINAAALASLLKQCSRVASRKGNDATSHVLIEVEGGQLALAAQNGSQQIVRRTRTASLRIALEGGICVAAQKLEQIVSALPGDKEVKLAVNDEKLVVTCGRSRFSLMTQGVDNFPRITVSDPIAEFAIDAEKLRLGGKAVSTCCARDDVRQFLNGMLLTIENGTAALVGSDGHRMGVYEVTGVEGPVAKVIIPTTIVDEFLNFATEANARIRLYPNLVSVVSDSGELYSKLVDGSYPDYRRLIAPSASPTRLLVNRAQLLSAVQRVSLMSDERIQAVRLQVSNDETLICAVGVDSSGEEAVSGALTGTPLEVGFNARYLGDILKVMTEDEIEFEFNGASVGTHIAPRNCTQMKFVLMPMRV
jgi:DNA polymerase III subunit beta